MCGTGTIIVDHLNRPDGTILNLRTIWNVDLLNFIVRSIVPLRRLQNNFERTVHKCLFDAKLILS